MRQVYIEKYGLSGPENLTDNNWSVLGNQTGLRSFALFPSFPRHRVHTAPPSLRLCPGLGPAPPRLVIHPALAGEEWGRTTSMACARRGEREGAEK